MRCSSFSTTGVKRAKAFSSPSLHALRSCVTSILDTSVLEGTSAESGIAASGPSEEQTITSGTDIPAGAGTGEVLIKCPRRASIKGAQGCAGHQGLHRNLDLRAGLSGSDLALQQVHDLLFEDGDVGRSYVFGINVAIAFDQEGDGQTENAAVEFSNFRIAHHDRIVHLVARVEIADGFRFVVHRNADNL